VADGVAYVLVVPAEPIDPSDNEGVSSAQPVVETATLRALGEPGAQTGDAVVRDDLVDDEASRARMGELVLDGLSLEAYTLSQRGLLNENNAEAQTIVANGGYPFAPANRFNFNAPNLAQCAASLVSCTARVVAAVAYFNYRFSALDNLSFRPEFYNDMEGQRTPV
jgi:hypothetical protein